MAQHDLVMIDPGKLGSKIREIRKQKQLTLVEVAERLGYASGKLSNIEKGKRVKFPIDELKEIARALNVSVDSFLEFEPNQLAEQYEMARKKLITAEFKINTGLYREVKNSLDDIEKQVIEFSLIHLDAYLQFLLGQYYFKAQEVDKAFQHFSKVIRSSSKGENVPSVKLRAYQALLKIEFERNHIEDALEFAHNCLHFEKEAIEETGDTVYIFYNIAILYTYTNQLDLARYYIDRCRNNINASDEMIKLATGMSVVIHLLNKEPGKAKEDYLKSMQLVHSSSDQEHYLWLLAIGLHFDHIQHSNERVLVLKFSEIKSLLELEVPESLLSKKIECAHLWVRNEIAHHQYLKPLEILDNCKIYHKELRDYKLKASTFKLEANIHKLIGNSKESVVSALKNAVYYYNDPAEKSIQKSILLYEIAEYEEPELAQNELLKSFYEHSKNEYYQTLTYRELLPRLRY
ncbi:hypothetical protein PTI45_03946 [Paenibacillus nuruki]|uniref:HTH cro/C1-type domain-containing protein n=1 Tax=Paenibacillus nuruki TaxID=1886670 RepID=A0A1E3L0I2_9BACL|nr:helix-turn-helix transcriptional regulator [Paenibacillus nuruki]ODP26695.1 hypothetical protein PTI45_03946 [Paenibacillus nuruki]